MKTSLPSETCVAMWNRISHKNESTDTKKILK